MKFKINTSNWTFSREDVEFLENYDLRFKSENNNRYSILGDDTINIHSLEELIDIQESLGELILMRNNKGELEIEIYNDYRE